MNEATLTGWKKKTITMCLLLVCFFIFSYDGIHHWDEASYLYNAAFSEPSELETFHHFKIGHLLILKSLVQIVGMGMTGLLFISFAYAVMMLCFVYFSFIFLKRLLGQEAYYATIVLAFLPLTLYLSFKALSEVPSLLFGIISLLSLLYAFSPITITRRSLMLLASGVFLFLSSLCRVEALIMLASFILALLITRKFKTRVIALYGCFVLTLSILLTLIGVTLLTLNLQDMFLYATTFQEKTRYTLLENILMAFLEGGLFYPFIFPSFFRYKDEHFKFALFWLVFASVSSVVIMDHIEARRLCWNIIPLSILIFIGMKETYEKMRNKLNRKGVLLSAPKVLFVFLFFLLLVGNYFLIAHGPDKIDERDYSGLFERLDNIYGDDKVILVPNKDADYCFIKFAFPEEIVIKVGEEGEPELLRKFENKALIYVVWNIEVNAFVYKYKKSNYEYSWIGKSSEVVLEKVVEEGRYTAYLVNAAESLKGR